MKRVHITIPSSVVAKPIHLMEPVIRHGQIRNEIIQQMINITYRLNLNPMQPALGFRPQAL